MIETISQWLAEAWAWLTHAIDVLGYPGVVSLMALESSFFPFPSEVVVPPAGALAHEGKMSLPIVIAAGIAGSMIGALFNYWVAVKLGRPFLLRYGRYVLISERTFERAERFFRDHGEIGTFVGRLLPGIRQVISFPAGLARMSMGRFCLFTALGSGIWVTILAFVGYWVGNDPEVIKGWLNRILLYILPGLVLLVVGYVWWYRRRKRQEAALAPVAEADE